jgi:glycerol-3-phosphate O-acyltransferase / dihydroxyacetone phosphate acyltransferase
MTTAYVGALRWASVAYRILQWLLRLMSKVFFRHIEVVGLENIPSDGAVIFAGNHPNSLIDPVLIITTCGKKVHFAAKDTLFKSWLMRRFLRGLGAVPVARKDDHGGGTGGKVDNEAAFTAMFEVLGKGGAIGIFPEGLSHDESQLARLKTGAARLALGAAVRTPATPVYIVPCGLVFINPKRFRSRVLVQYGTPIRIDAEWQGKHTDEPIGAAKQLTTRLDAAMRALTVNATDWDTVRALDTVRRLYQPLDISIEDRVELARRFNTYYPRFKDDPRVVGLMGEVRAYEARLDAIGVSDRELARDLSTGETIGRIMRHVMLLLVWLPLTVPGIPLHVPTLLLANIAGRKLTPRKDVVATTKVLTGMLLVLVAYTAVIAILWWRIDWRFALAAAIVLPGSGIATLRVLDRFHLLRRGLGVLVRRNGLRREVEALRAVRADLATRTIRVVSEVKPADLVALFPPNRRRDPNAPAEDGESAAREEDLDDRHAEERKPT